MMASAGCIYILREREFIKTKENIYKIGRTSKTIHERFKQYPKNSELINSFNVNDVLIYERLAISEFSKLFIHRNDIGNEYFEGDIILMMDILCKICNLKYQKINFETLKEKETSLPTETSVPKDATKQYKCLNCPFSTNTKRTLTNHIEKRKTKCNSKLNNKCKYCTKEFKNKKSFYLHIKNHCHIKKKQDNEIDEKLKNLNIDISNDNMEPILTNMINTTTIVTDNYYVLPFGQEDITFITKEDIIVLLDSKIKCIEEYIKLVHLNPNHTKNYNLCAYDDKFNMIKSWDGTKWIYKQPEEMNIAIFKAVFNLIEITTHRFGLKIPAEILDYHKTMCEYEEVFKSYNEINPIKEKQILKQIKAIMTILYNKKDEVISEHAILKEKALVKKKKNL
jgi:hypothetical protein